MLRTWHLTIYPFNPKDDMASEGTSGTSLPAGLPAAHRLLTIDHLTWVDARSSPVKNRCKVRAAAVCRAAWPLGSASQAQTSHSHLPPSAPLDRPTVRGSLPCCIQAPALARGGGRERVREEAPGRPPSGRPYLGLRENQSPPESLRWPRPGGQGGWLRMSPGSVDQQSWPFGAPWEGPLKQPPAGGGGGTEGLCRKPGCGEMR